MTSPPERDLAKSIARAIATLLVSPNLLSFWLKSPLLGRDRALEGSSQLLAIVPGLPGRYMRQAFLARVLAHCSPTSVIEFGTIFSQTGARIDDRAYIGPGCHLGLVHIGAYAMLAAGVHVPSGAHTHRHERIDEPMQSQPMDRRMVSIGANSWIGSAAVVMADVGRDAIVGAGAVVTHPVPDGTIVGGVPARVIKQRLPPASE